MALNFGLLDQGGPTNFFEGYRQADKEMQANAMAQQRAAQAKQEFGMRQQEFAAGQADKQRVAKAARVTQGLAIFRDALLRSKDPAAARRVVQMQYADPDIGPIRSRLGTLEQALAEVPEETSAFQKYLEDEAMGMEEVRKQQASDRAFNIAMGRAPAPAAPTPTPTPAPMAAATPIPTSGVSPSNIGAETFISTGVGAPNFNGTATRLNTLTGEVESVPLRENQAAAGLFDKLTQTYSPVFGTLALTAPQILTRLNNKLAALTNNPPEDMTPQIRAEMIAAVKEEIIATAAGKRDMFTPTNAMAPQAQAAAVTNAMAPQAPAAAAPPSELQRLIAQRDSLSAIFNQTPRVKTNIENLNKDIERLSRTKEKINVIGVAKGTGNPVYLDSISDEQYVYVADTDGKQKRKLYSGPVDRSTSNVSQTVSNKVDAFIPASEAAQTQFMQESRQTFNALKNAQPTLDNIEAAKALVPTAKGFMGAGGEPLLLAASFLNNRLGMKIDTKGVTDASELRSRLFFGILDNLKKLDSQPSQAQQAIMQEALGNLGTDPNALGRVLDAFGDSIRTKVDLHNAEVSDAETRGVKFPYSARIVLKPKSGGASNPHAKKTDEQIKKELGL